MNLLVIVSPGQALDYQDYQPLHGLADDDRIPAKKGPCLTPTLMDEGQARNPNTTYNGI